MKRVIGTFCLGFVAGSGCKSHEPKTKQEQAGDAIARVAAIEPKLAKVRGLEFESEVAASYQTAADFRSYMHRSVEKSGRSIGDQTDALVALGLLPRATDLGEAVENAYATQAAAYYDSEAKRFFLVMVPDSSEMLDFISAHELTHALQDQHFGLTKYLHAAGNADAAAARRFVVEGDAMLSAIAYLVFDKTRVSELTSPQIAAMRPKLEQFATLDPRAMSAMLKQQVSGSSLVDPEIKKSLDAMDNIPLTVLVPLMDSYMKGAVLALDAYERGGWRGVDSLYTDPPESTEQVLHPKDRLLQRRDRPHRVTLPTLNNYTLVASDVIGELQWSVYFSLWKHEGDGHEETNWGGDRYAVVRNKDSKLVALIATTWDTEYDATVFFNAYVSTLKTRYGGKTSVDGDQAHVERGNDSTWVLRSGTRVYIVDGGDDDELIETLVNDTKFE